MEVDEIGELGQFVEFELVTEDLFVAGPLIDLARMELTHTKRASVTYLEMFLVRRENLRQAWKPCPDPMRCQALGSP